MPPCPDYPIGISFPRVSPDRKALRRDAPAATTAAEDSRARGYRSDAEVSVMTLGGASRGSARARSEKACHVREASRQRPRGSVRTSARVTGSLLSAAREQGAQVSFTVSLRLVPTRFNAPHHDSLCRKPSLPANGEEKAFSAVCSRCVPDTFQKAGNRVGQSKKLAKPCSGGLFWFGCSSSRVWVWSYQRPEYPTGQ